MRYSALPDIQKTLPHASPNSLSIALTSLLLCCAVLCCAAALLGNRGVGSTRAAAAESCALHLQRVCSCRPATLRACSSTCKDDSARNTRPHSATHHSFTRLSPFATEPQLCSSQHGLDTPYSLGMRTFPSTAVVMIFHRFVVWLWFSKSISALGSYWAPMLCR